MTFFLEKLLGSLVNPLTLALAFAVWAFLRKGEGENLPRKIATYFAEATKV